MVRQKQFSMETEFSLNFTGLAISFFNGYVPLAVIDLFWKLFSSIAFCKAKKVSTNRFLFFNKWRLNVLEPESLELALKNTLGIYKAIPTLNSEMYSSFSSFS